MGREKDMIGSMNDPFLHRMGPFSLRHHVRARYGGRNVAQGLGNWHRTLSDVRLQAAAPLGHALVGASAALDDVARAVSMPRVSVARLASRGPRRAVGARTRTGTRQPA